MIRSMTGYGAAEAELGGQRLSAQVQSVNHRFAEISVRLPRSLSPFENQLRNLLAQSLGRGKITFNAAWDGREEAGRRVRFDHDRARQYLDEIRRLKAALRIDSEVDLATVLGLPDVIVNETAGLPEEEAWTFLEKLAKAAVADLLSMRAREGQALSEEFSRRLDRIETLAKQAEARGPLRPAEARDRMMARLKPLLGDVEVDATRLAQEVAFLAERLDCTEECVRLAAHIAQFRELMADPEPAGRKLNFLLQEMNREVNTLGSKANDTELAKLTIDLKDELEKLREQVQNVE
jgi:uncharacterized protein (TIGR00255 family)